MKIGSIIFDLDETLIHTVTKWNPVSANTRIPDFVFRTGSNMIVLYKRDYLDFLFRSLIQLGIPVIFWTAADKEYANLILKHILTDFPRLKVLAILTSKDCQPAKITDEDTKEVFLWDFTKPLTTVIKLFPYLKMEELLFVDDYDLNSVWNPDNFLIVKEFKALKSKKPDLTLLYLAMFIEYLQKLKTETDVRKIDLFHWETFVETKLLPGKK